MVGRRNALRWWRSSTIDLVSRVFMSCSDLGQDAVGVEVGWVDREQLEVGVTVEAEQPDRPLGAVQHDQADRVRAGRADRQRLFDRQGQLMQRRRKIAKHAGSSQRSNGLATSNAPGLRSNNAR